MDDSGYYRVRTAIGLRSNNLIYSEWEAVTEQQCIDLFGRLLNMNEFKQEMTTALFKANFVGDYFTIYQERLGPTIVMTKHVETFRVEVAYVEAR